MTYAIGSMLDVHSLGSDVDAVGCRVKVTARAYFENGLVCVGCHQHPLGAFMKNGGTVEGVEPPNPGDRRNLMVTAFGTLVRRDGYGSGGVHGMQWDGGVRSNITGVAELQEHVMTIEVVEPPSAAASSGPVMRTITQGIHACLTHPEQHFFLAMLDQRGRMQVGQLRVGDGHGQICAYSFADYAGCTPRPGAELGIMSGGAVPGASGPIRFASEEQAQNYGART